MLLLPPKELSSCIAAAVVRDTRGVSLVDKDRFNYFPATPMVSVTFLLAGELRMATTESSLAEVRGAKPLSAISITMQQDAPIVSWSPGEIYAVTVGFYPDAWMKLGCDLNVEIAPEAIRAAAGHFNAHSNPQSIWKTLCDALLPVWRQSRHADGLPDWSGSDRLADWARHLFTRVAVTAPGRSARTFQRRLRYWTKGTKQSLDHYAAVEDLHRRIVAEPDAPLAGLAVDAGFSDQSHMSRAIRRTTGFSPARLNRLIETEESFWCYRLFGERF